MKLFSKICIEFSMFKLSLPIYSLKIKVPPPFELKLTREGVLRKNMVAV